MPETWRTDSEAQDSARLGAIQARVRGLVQQHAWVGDAIRQAFQDFLALCAKHDDLKASQREREIALARDLLGRHRLIDPNARDPCLFLDIDGLCPTALAEALERRDGGSRARPVDYEGLEGQPPHPREMFGGWPEQVEREGAAAALAALEWNLMYQSRDTPEDQRDAMAGEWRAARDAGTHVGFRWMIVLSRPADWKEPPDPQSLARSHLRRFSEGEYRTIALHRLGGLADLGELRPIVPEPPDPGELGGMADYIVWRFRAVFDNDLDKPPARLCGGDFPPDVAEQMLRFVEAWIAAESGGEQSSQRIPPSRTADNDSGDEDGDTVLLTETGERVLLAMSRFGAERSLTRRAIAAETEDKARKLPAVSEKTVGTVVRELSRAALAESVHGGVRLTSKGRRLAARLSD